MIWLFLSASYYCASRYANIGTNLNTSIKYRNRDGRLFLRRMDRRTEQYRDDEDRQDA